MPNHFHLLIHVGENPRTMSELHTASSAQFGNLTVTGTATFASLTVNGDAKVHNLTVNGKIITAGDAPELKVDVAAGVGGSASIDGNDSAGTLTIISGTLADGQTKLPTDTIVNVTFTSPYSKRPKLLLDRSNEQSLSIVFVKDVTPTGFTLRAVQPLVPNTTYTLDYIAVE